MGYLHINNLYKDTTILLFRECYALEKIHGTSAHITLRWNLRPVGEGLMEKVGVQVHYFSGGTPHATFVGLFNEAALVKAFTDMALPQDRSITIYGESYGGKEQGMSLTYGKVPKFVVFDVQIGDCWLDVPNAEQVAEAFGLEFVHYVKVSTDLKELDAQRDAPSMQAVRNGVSQLISREEAIAQGYAAVPTCVLEDGYVVNACPREGVVLRPLKEMTLNNGARVIVKHKGEAFQETASPRKVELDPTKLAKMAEADAIVTEWVTDMRLRHVLDKIAPKNEGRYDMSQTPTVCEAMLEDVLREGAGEIDLADEARIKKAIKSGAAKKFKEFVTGQLRDARFVEAAHALMEGK